MPEAATSVVLDTHVWVWWAGGVAIEPHARRLIDAAAGAGQVYVPAISVWEVAMLVSKQRLTFATPVAAWCDGALALPGFVLAPLEPRIALDACALPGELHADPADRIIVATTRVLGATLVTRDEKLLAYGAAGHLAVARA